jgi:hypothetical protein
MTEIMVVASCGVKKWLLGVMKVDERPCKAGTLFMFWLKPGTK